MGCDNAGCMANDGPGLLLSYWLMKILGKDLSYLEPDYQMIGHFGSSKSYQNKKIVISHEIKAL